MTTVLSQIEAIAFDLDNTLYDRDAAVNAWIQTVFQDRPDLCREAMQVDNSGFIPRRNFYTWMAERVDWAETFEDIERHYQKNVRLFLRPDEAINEAVRLLAKRFPLGILTNGGSHFQRVKYELLGITDCFAPSRVFVSSEVGYEKPHRRCFEPLVEAMGVPAERILFVGDNPENDILGAHGIGMKTCWVQLCPEHVCESPPDLTIRSVAELPGYFGL